MVAMAAFLQETWRNVNNCTGCPRLYRVGLGRREIPSPSAFESSRWEPSRKGDPLYRSLMVGLLALLFLAPAGAAPLETSFFTWEVPEGWTVSRNPSGLWQLTAPGP